jgi:hypothetical protein
VVWLDWWVAWIRIEGERDNEGIGARLKRGSEGPLFREGSERRRQGPLAAIGEMCAAIY